MPRVDVADQFKMILMALGHYQVSLNLRAKRYMADWDFGVWLGISFGRVLKHHTQHVCRPTRVTSVSDQIQFALVSIIRMLFYVSKHNSHASIRGLRRQCRQAVRHNIWFRKIVKQHTQAWPMMPLPWNLNDILAVEPEIHSKQVDLKNTSATQRTWADLRI